MKGKEESGEKGSERERKRNLERHRIVKEITGVSTAVGS